jgi:uncharacterized membrane protein YgcG
MLASPLAGRGGPLPACMLACPRRPGQARPSRTPLIPFLSQSISICSSKCGCVAGQTLKPWLGHGSAQHAAEAASSRRMHLQCNAMAADSAAPVATAVAFSQPAAASAVAAAAPPFAALSRVLLYVNSSGVFRGALNKQRPPVSGPLGLLLFIFTLLAASVAAIRSALLRRGKSCRTCRGFGLQRCRLCLGSGRVDWAAKLQHFDVCPLCMNRRFVVCTECGGHYHRPMFVHRRRQAGGALEPLRRGGRGGSGGSSSGGSDGSSERVSYPGPIVLTASGAGAALAVPMGAQPALGSVLSSMSD